MTFPEFFYYVNQPHIWQTLPESAAAKFAGRLKWTAGEIWERPG